MIYPQPRIMLWVDGERVEVLLVGAAELLQAVLDLLRSWPGLANVGYISYGDAVCEYMEATPGPNARAADPLAEAMLALEPLRLDWQDVTTRSAVACL